MLNSINIPDMKLFEIGPLSAKQNSLAQVTEKIHILLFSLKFSSEKKKSKGQTTSIPKLDSISTVGFIRSQTTLF